MKLFPSFLEALTLSLLSPKLDLYRRGYVAGLKKAKTLLEKEIRREEG